MLSIKTKRIPGESLAKRKLKSDNVAIPNGITENNTKSVCDRMAQNMEVLDKTNFSARNEDEEKQILPEQWESAKNSDSNVDPCVVKTDYPIMDIIDIGPVKVELQEDAETSETMHSEESSLNKDFSICEPNLPEECAEQKFLEEFLKAYRSSPGMWDINSDDYRDPKRKREQCACLLAKYQEYYPDADKQQMQKKIRSIRSRYYRVQRKIEYLNNKQLGSGKKYESNKWFFDVMSSVCAYKEPLQPVDKTAPFAERRIMPKRGREALKNDPIPLEYYREKTRERARKNREKVLEYSNNKEHTLESMEKDRLNQESDRERNKIETIIECEPNASKQVLENALTKVEGALPRDLDKRIKVINVLYEKYVNPVI
ncbi:uncharacterized protein LOC135438868 [Drosophila montana]|uniref:uncharacterized protein LOC135438868 n=1 Tax=Drosophila montana TaxID=40370 RepID=UPI00313EC855